MAENWKKSKFGDAYLSLSRAEIFKLKFFHGNGLHLGGRVLEILHLEAKIKPCRFSYPKITRFENGIILLKIDLKWPQNGWRWKIAYKKNFGLFFCPRLAQACPKPKMASKWVKMIFPGLVTNRKVLDNYKIYLHVRYQKNS